MHGPQSGSGQHLGVYVREAADVNGRPAYKKQVVDSEEGNVRVLHWDLARRRWKISMLPYNDAPGAAWAKPEDDPSPNTTPADVKGLQWHVWHPGEGTSRSVTQDPGRGYFASEGLAALTPADWSAGYK